MYTISLENQIVFITGAVQGIGKEIALKLAEAGCKGMCIVDIQKGEKGEQTQKELEAFGTEVEFVLGDVSEEDTIKAACDLCMDKWGKIDILVNNAGVAAVDVLETAELSTWDRLIKINLRSMFLTMKMVSDIMREQKEGIIINMSSIAGVTGGSTGVAYGSSKAGVIGLTKFAAKELGKYNIRVNAVAPGTIETEMLKNAYKEFDEETVKRKLSTIPMQRMGTPEEVGKAVLFLASDLASYVSGDTLMVTGARMS